jgi:predicted esterase
VRPAEPVGDVSTPGTPHVKPVPPLDLLAPPEATESLDGKDLKGLESSTLFALAREAMAKGDFSRAATFQYWYVQKAKKGRYDLACFLAQVDQVEPAFYWLQRAAMEEGVDSRHAQVDTDLNSLRRDQRWEQVRTFLEGMNRYYKEAPIGRVALILPKGHDKATPIPVVLWLHGHGATPEGFVNTEAQGFADELQVALVGVSGTKPRGPDSFVWAEDAARDGRRLREALAEVGDRVVPKKGCLVTIGFSQGAQVGLEVAVRAPEDYAGSIVLSPGARSTLEEIKPMPALKGHVYILGCGEKEHHGNVELTLLDATYLRFRGAETILSIYPNESAHAFPRDFNKRFPEWVKLILKSRGGS